MGEILCNFSFSYLDFEFVYVRPYSIEDTLENIAIEHHRDNSPLLKNGMIKRVHSREVLCSVIATSQVWPFKLKLINIKWNLKIQSLSHTSHLTSVQQPHGVSGCHTEQQWSRVRLTGFNCLVAIWPGTSY